MRNTHTVIVADSLRVVLARTPDAEPYVTPVWAFVRGEVVVHYLGRGSKRTMMDQAQIPHREAEATGVYVVLKAMTDSH